MIASAWWLWLSIGLFVGTIVGIFVAAILSVAARADRTSEIIFREISKDRSDPDEPDLPAG